MDSLRLLFISLFDRIDAKGKNKFQKTVMKFQKAGKTTPVTCVVFIPITRVGILVKKLREKEDQKTIVYE